MASVHSNVFNDQFRVDEHPVWYKQFSSRDRDRMLEDDLHAGYWIPALLAAIVCLGLAMMAFSVIVPL